MIARRIRNEAALFCAHLASFVSRPGEDAGPFFVVMEELGTSLGALDVVRAAFRAVNEVVGELPNHGYHEHTCSECGRKRPCGSLYYAEAEAILRDGWSPP